MAVEPAAMRPDRPVPAWMFRAWELLAPRVPAAVIRFVFRLMLRLPRGSRTRRWAVLTISAIGWEAAARNHDELVLPVWDPDCEWHFDATFRSLDFDSVYRGHKGVKRAFWTWTENWSDPSFTLREVLDGGGTLVHLTTLSGSGARSGAPVRLDLSSVVRLDPLIVDWHTFTDDAEALAEAGFAPVAQDAIRDRP